MGSIAVGAAVVAVAMGLATGALGSGAAAYTTFSGIDATVGGCLDNPTGVNCNNYAAKGDVYVNGGPVQGNGLPDGTYYFTVLVPGYQNGGFIDGANGNLSDASAGSTTGDLGSGDSYLCREITVSNNGQTFAYIPDAGCSTTLHAQGTDPQDNTVTQLMPYDDTSNAGGVYIMAICEVGATSSSQCKFDAFRIAGGTPTAATDLSVSKTATPAFTRTFTWGITKTACAHGLSGCVQTVTQTGGSVTFDYTVTATKTLSGDSGWQVGGTITVSNGDSGDAYDVSVTDSIDNSGTCDVGSTGTDTKAIGTVAAGTHADVSYVCTFTSNPGSGTNSVTASWNPNLGDGTVTPDSSKTNTAGYTFADPTTVNGNQITVTDTFNGTQTTLGSPTSTTPYNYTHSIPVGNTSCAAYQNTATFTGANVTTGAKGSDSQTVTVCPKVNGLTIGYWQNKNGQAQINGGNPSGHCTALYTYLTQFNPFKNIANDTCGTSAGYTQNKATTSTGIAGYVYNVIKAANASGASMNAMLKAQMLGTALSVYFSTSSLGTINVNLTKICNMIDNTSAGTATCGTSGYLANVGNAFITNGALPGSDAKFPLQPSNPLASGGCTTSTAPTAMSVECLLWNAASWSDAGGVNWYSNNKTTQGLAKNAFDAINNSVAVAAGP